MAKASAAPAPKASGTPSTSRRKFIAGSTLLLLPVMPRTSQAATILAVRTWPADEYTRVTLEMDTELTAKHFTLDHPRRLVLDIRGLTLNRAINELISKIKPDDPYISNVRVGQYQPGVVRLVFDLKQDVAPQIFTLKPIDQYKYRLVLDLYPKFAKDPLMALLKDTKDDPLSDVLDQLAQNEPDGASHASAAGDRRQGAAKRTGPHASDSSSGTRRRPLLIALDPGHGGEDPGATGRRGTHEKHVVLDIAKRLKKMIDAQPNMRAYLTRDRDFFVPLYVRVQKARRAGADLFISIHADGWIKPTARGSSVWVLSRSGATSASARWLAKKENDADLVGGMNVGAHDKGIAKVLMDLSTSAQITDSMNAGTRVLSEIGKIHRLHNKRIERAGFAVLKSPDIPSILVETAFITNPEEERLLRTTAHQQRIARAILAGVKDYFASSPALAKRA